MTESIHDGSMAPATCYTLYGAAERALPGPVLERKNHYGSRSQRGTLVAAILYSLCETAKLHGLDPRAYLTAATKAAIREPGAVTMPKLLLEINVSDEPRVCQAAGGSV